MLGFKARKSWRLVEVTECPVADPRLVAALPALAGSRRLSSNIPSRRRPFM
jgi:tRNA/tmRNA/rRNA uracil-C5-methylase (TrmA/RlmC/RlmD family)